MRQDGSARRLLQNDGDLPDAVFLRIEYDLALRREVVPEDRPIHAWEIYD